MAKNDGLNAEETIYTQGTLDRALENLMVNGDFTRQESEELLKHLMPLGGYIAGITIQSIVEMQRTGVVSERKKEKQKMAEFYILLLKNGLTPCTCSKELFPLDC